MVVCFSLSADGRDFVVICHLAWFCFPRNRPSTTVSALFVIFAHNHRTVSVYRLTSPDFHSDYITATNLPTHCMPKAEDPRLRIPTPYERNVGIPSFRKPIVLIKSIKGDAKYVKTSQSDPNTSAPDPPTKLFVNSQLRPWNHAAELDYSQPKDWDEQRIISYIFQNGFSIPARDPSCPWVTITGRDGVTTMLPRGYRTPLLFTAKFQWESLRLIMASTSKTAEWEEYKYDILHVSRLCTRFLADARRAVGLTGMEKGWRSIMFDRALTRYYRCWLVNRPAFLRDFWYEFGEEQYERDVLKNGTVLESFRRDVEL